MSTLSDRSCLQVVRLGLHVFQSRSKRGTESLVFRMFFHRDDYRQVVDGSKSHESMPDEAAKYVIYSRGITATRWFTLFLLISSLTTFPIGFLCFKLGASTNEARRIDDWFCKWYQGPPSSAHQDDMLIEWYQRLRERQRPSSDIRKCIHCTRTTKPTRFGILSSQVSESLLSNNEVLGASQLICNAATIGGRGFIKHPDISPETHCLSVFHQLHCLVSSASH